MRTLKFSAIGLCGVLVVMAPTQAAFQSVQKQSFQAEVSVEGIPTASFTVELRDALDPLGSPVRAGLNWSNVIAGQTGWKMADQCFVLKGTITDASGGIQMYTHNSQYSAPLFFPPWPNHSPESYKAGLLELAVSTAGFAFRTIPMAWSIKAASMTVSGPNPTLLPGDPVSGPATGPDNRFQWVIIKDFRDIGIDTNGDGYVDPRTNDDSPDTTPFENGNEDVMVMNSVGIHAAQGAGGFFSHPDGRNAYLYMQADYTTASVGYTYFTNKLYIESFTN